MTRRAFTLIDLSVAIAALAILFAALLPIMRQGRHASGQIASMANLQSLSTAHAMYGWDWFDRQVTWIPDDAGLYANGQANWATNYIAAAGCPPQLLLGWDPLPIPTIWGYFLGCGSFPGSTGSAGFYQPLSFAPASGAGTFRLANAKAFSVYVDGRFYSETFYAPNDAITIELASTMFDYVGEFSIQPPLGTDGLPQIVNSSYALSPSAMWSPKVLSRNVTTGLWYTNPSTLPDGYLSPNVSQCAHPDLKTRMIEHNWNLGAPGPTNPAFSGGFTPYFFNHGLDAAPLTLFFDGHVDVLSTAQAVADDAVVLAETRGDVGLWTRDTPYGPNGYYGAQSVDGTVASHHILTAEGILGRDVLSVAAPRPAATSSRSPRTPLRPIRLDSMAPQAMPIK